MIKHPTVQPITSHKSPIHATSLLRIAQEFGTPTYVYVENTIRNQCRLLKKHLLGVNTRLLYAMKANSHPAILQIIRSEEFGIDAVSPGELHLARRVGFRPDEILYTANNITDDEMHLVQKEGVLLNLGELSRLERFWNGLSRVLCMCAFKSTNRLGASRTCCDSWQIN